MKFFRDIKISEIMNFRTEEEKKELVKGNNSAWVNYFTTPFIEKVNLYMDKYSIIKDDDYKNFSNKIEQMTLGKIKDISKSVILCKDIQVIYINIPKNKTKEEIIDYFLKMEIKDVFSLLDKNVKDFISLREINSKKFGESFLGIVKKLLDGKYDSNYIKDIEKGVLKDIAIKTQNHTVYTIKNRFENNPNVTIKKLSELNLSKEEFAFNKIVEKIGKDKVYLGKIISKLSSEEKSGYMINDKYHYLIKTNKLLEGNIIVNGKKEFICNCDIKLDNGDYLLIQPDGNIVGDLTDLVKTDNYKVESVSGELITINNDRIINYITSKDTSDIKDVNKYPPIEIVARKKHIINDNTWIEADTKFNRIIMHFGRDIVKSNFGRETGKPDWHIKLSPRTREMKIATDIDGEIKRDNYGNVIYEKDRYGNPVYATKEMNNQIKESYIEIANIRALNLILEDLEEIYKDKDISPTSEKYKDYINNFEIVETKLKYESAKAEHVSGESDFCAINPFWAGKDFSKEVLPFLTEESKILLIHYKAELRNPEGNLTLMKWMDASGIKTVTINGAKFNLAKFRPDPNKPEIINYSTIDKKSLNKELKVFNENGKEKIFLLNNIQLNGKMYEFPKFEEEFRIKKEKVRQELLLYENSYEQETEKKEFYNQLNDQILNSEIA